MMAALEFQSSDEMRRRYSDAKAKLWGPRPQPIRFIPRPTAPPETVEVKEPERDLLPEPEPFVLKTSGDISFDTEKPTLRELLVHVAVKHGLDFNDVVSAGRNAFLVHARHEYFYLAARETLHSYPMIAKACGGRDHTTALYGVLKYCERHGIKPPRGTTVKSIARKREREHLRYAAKGIRR